MTTRQARRRGLLTTPDPQLREQNPRQNAAEWMLEFAEQEPAPAPPAPTPPALAPPAPTPPALAPPAPAPLAPASPAHNNDELEEMMQRARNQPGLPVPVQGQLTIQWPPVEPLPRVVRPVPVYPGAERQAQQYHQAVQAIQAVWAAGDAFRAESNRAIQAAVVLARQEIAREQDQVVPEQRQAPEEPLHVLWGEEAERIIRANLGDNVNAGADAVDIVDVANIVFGDQEVEDIIEVPREENQVMGEQEVVQNLEGNDDDEILEVQEVVNVPETPPPAPNNEHIGRPENLRMQEGTFEYNHPMPGRHDHVLMEVQNLPVRRGRTQHHHIQIPQGDRPHRFEITLRGVPSRFQRVYWRQYPHLGIEFRFDERELDGDREQREIFFISPREQPRREEQE